ncbi:MAG: PAS domain-containing protein [Pseudomonadota bacterium]
MNDRFASDGSFDVRRLVDQVPSMLAYWNRDMKCQFANAAYERWFGVGRDSLIGTSIRELLGAELFVVTEPFIQGALKGEAQTFERLAPGRGGILRHSLAQYIPDVVEGVVLGFTAQVTDISGLHHTQCALRDSEQKFRTLSESSPYGVFHTDAQGSITYANRQWDQLWGDLLDGNAGDRWLHAVHPGDRADVLMDWNQAVPLGQKFDREFRIQHTNGEVVLVHLRARPLHSEAGTVTGFVGAAEDVTAQRQADQRLRASESFLDRVGRLAAVGGWQMDLPVGPIQLSEQARRMCEVDEPCLATLDDGIALYAPEVRSVISAAVQQAIAHGRSWDMELPFLTAKGRPLWVRSFGEVEYDNGRPARLMGAFQDITEHRQRKSELEREQALRVYTERQVQSLDLLLRERNEMVGVLAHEVRQPLNNASAALQSAAAALLQVGEGVASLRLTRAQAVMTQVMASIDNTLAVASLLARPEPIHREDTDIDTLLAVTIADMPSRERSRIEVHRVTTTRTASMDMSLMRLALRNLLANALRYSPPTAQVVVKLTDSDSPLALVIDVIDTGGGIEPDMVSRLFQRGARGKGAARGMGGHGLGLYIVRRVMELHSSRVFLAHNTSQGATMRLVIEQSPGD